MKLWLGAICCSVGLHAEEVFNYDEAAVPPYQLPELLRLANGEKCTSKEQWTARRAEILALLEREMFGKAPARPKLRFDVREEATAALGGKALRKQVRLYFSEKEQPSLDLLLYLPASGKPAPVVLGLNFMGNQSVHADPQIFMTSSWVNNTQFGATEEHQALEKSRGIDTEKWQIEYAISRGYGVVTAYCGDIDPDFDDSWKNGVHGLFPEIEQRRDGSTWGTLAAWAWGLSCAMDYLEQEKLVDAKQVAVQGFSRLGKAALWAGAQDQRFALVISQNSGAGGAALNQRIFGETVARLNHAFPHWFCGNFKKYSDKENTMAFDSHMLLALCAPRPLLITSATDDRWSDPLGEFLAGKAANPAYQLLGHRGLQSEKQPPAMQLSAGQIGYFLRKGSHDTTLADWTVYADFCDLHLKK